MHVLSGVLDLSAIAHEGSEAGRDTQLAVALLRNDIGSARRVARLEEGALELVSASGESIRYTWDPWAELPDTLWRTVEDQDPAPVAAGIDSVSFMLETVSRPYTVESDQPVVREKTIASFAPGDWDAWIASTPCVYDARGERKIDEHKWCAEEFWTTEDFTTFSRAAVRAAAKDKIPPDEDLLVRVHLANPIAPRYPGTLIAQGVIPRASLTDSYEWHEITLTPVSVTPIPAGGLYWIVFSPKNLLPASYAGHVEYENISGCLAGGWPGTDIHYRESDDAGVKWSLRTQSKEAFFQVTGLQATLRLTEITQTLADTLGVSYAFKVEAGEEPQRSAGFIALPGL